MQSRLDTLACEQLDWDEWKFTCALLRHNPEARSSEFIVYIPGLKRKLLPCQAHSVVRSLLMHQPDSIRHCFHGHSMGIGKTTITFAIHRIQHLINLMRADIKARPNKH